MYWFEGLMVFLGFGLWAYFIILEKNKLKKECKCGEGKCNQKQ